jgi:hypothetical protein
MRSYEHATSREYLVGRGDDVQVSVQRMSDFDKFIET